MTWKNSVLRTLLPASFAALVGLSAAPETALAAPPPYIFGLGVHPSDPDAMVLASALYFGALVFSTDGGETWGMRCSPRMEAGGGNAFFFRWDGGAEARTSPTISITSGGDVLVPAGFSGLLELNTSGCGVERRTEVGGVSAVSLHPQDDSLAFLWAEDVADGNGGLVRRNADGSFEPFGTSPQQATEERITVEAMNVVARDAGLRFYLSVSPTPGDRAIRYSDDEGETWTQLELPPAPAAAIIARVAVLYDGDDSSRLMVVQRVSGAHDVLLTSEDGGESWTELLPGQLVDVSDVLQTPDGTFWVADRGEGSVAAPGGLWRMTAWGEPPCKVSESRAYSLAAPPGTGELLVVHHYELHAIDLATGDSTKKYGMDETDTVLDCPDEGDSIADWCGTQSFCLGGGRGWCGGNHWAFTPACDVYEAAGASVQCTGRTYDLEEGIRNVTWESCPETPSALLCQDFQVVDCGPPEERPASQGGQDGTTESVDGGATPGGSGSGSTGAPPASSGDASTSTGTSMEVDGATSGDGAGLSPPAPEDDDQGCLCTAPAHGARRLGGGVWFALGLGALLARRRRLCS